LLEVEMQLPMGSFAKLTDIRASEATATVYVNVAMLASMRRRDNVTPQHTELAFTLVRRL